ncbi:WD40 repeat-like protein [Saitoella complicata NRRL Y-17804]|nr:WD40 repeat-like protein [Saitoella complicata NRRL Y-17804]ODQ50429.1 WD40 repeat-like protein [Saitoella complicata NRRL Y-17804]
MVPLPSAGTPFESAAAAKAELSTFKATTFTRLHTDTVTSLAWNSTGTRLASGSRDCTIRIWNPERSDPRNTPDLKLPRGKAGVVRKIVWDPVQRKGEAERLATLNSDASVRIWDTKTKTVVAEVRCKTSHDPVLIGLAWSADGKFICAVSRDDYITLIDAQTFTVLTSTRGPYGASYASFHPTHPLLAVTAVQATQLHPYGKLSFYTYLPSSSSSDPSTIVLNEAIQLNAHVGSCSPPHFSPSPPHNLLLGGADSLISLYSTHEFYPIRTFDYNKGTGLAGGVKETGWTWCGGFVTRLGDDGVVWVGDCETGEEVWSSTSTSGGGQLGLKLTGSETLAWSPRGYVLALTVEGGKTIALLGLADAK